MKFFYLMIMIHLISRLRSHQILGFIVFNCLKVASIKNPLSAP